MGQIVSLTGGVRVVGDNEICFVDCKDLHVLKLTDSRCSYCCLSFMNVRVPSSNGASALFLPASLVGLLPLFFPEQGEKVLLCQHRRRDCPVSDAFSHSSHLQLLLVSTLETHGHTALRTRKGPSELQGFTSD